MVTEPRMIREATRSRPECAASDNMPILPLWTPVHNFRNVMTVAAITEMVAVRRLIEASNVLRLEMETGRAILTCHPLLQRKRSGVSAGKVHAFTARYRPAMPNV